MGPEGARALAAALTPSQQGTFSTSVHTLILDNNRLAGRSLSSEEEREGGLEALAETLKTNRVLTSLSMRGNCFGPKCAMAITAGLSRNSLLDTLNLTFVCIHQAAAEQLAEVVLAHPAMRVFSDIPMQYLKEDAIASLDLCNTAIGLPGAFVVSKLLALNGSLNTLNLAGEALCCSCPFGLR
eukprot:gene34272-biopygen23518